MSIVRFERDNSYGSFLFEYERFEKRGWDIGPDFNGIDKVTVEKRIVKCD